MAGKATTITTKLKGDILSLPATNAKLYRGSMIFVVIGTGYATGAITALGTTANLRFMGFAEETVDNSAGSAGDLNIRVRRGLRNVKMKADASVSAADIGKLFYACLGQTASQDQTVGLAGNAGVTNEGTSTPVGVCIGITSTTHVWLDTTVTTLLE